MDIYQELKRDHREIRAMLRELVSLEKDDDYRLLLIAEVRNALVSHGRAEEAVLYHSLRNVDKISAKLALQGLREHIEIETMLFLLQTVERVGANWKPLARKLCDLVDHHLHQEEIKTFAIAKKAFNQREANKMGQVFRGIKPAMEQRGELRSTLDMMLNLMPPGFAERIMPLIPSRPDFL